MESKDGIIITLFMAIQDRDKEGPKIESSLRRSAPIIPMEKRRP